LGGTHSCLPRPSGAHPWPKQRRPCLDARGAGGWVKSLWGVCGWALLHKSARGAPGLPPVGTHVGRLRGHPFLLAEAERTRAHPLAEASARPWAADFTLFPTCIPNVEPRSTYQRLTNAKNFL